MKRCSEMILSGYKGGIYEAITFLSVFFVWLWSEYIRWFCALYLIWEKKKQKKKTFVHHVGFRREQLSTPWEVVSHGAVKLEKRPEIIKSNFVCETE